MRIKISSIIKSFFQYAIVFSMILDCQSIYGNNLATPKIWAYLLITLLFIGGVGSFVFSGTIKITYQKQNKICWLLVILMYLALYILTVTNKSYTSRLVISVFILGIYYICCESESLAPELMYKFRNIVVIIAATSLFFWVSCSYLHIIPPTGYVYSTWTDTGMPKLVPNYFSLYFETQDIELPFFNEPIIRNTAIFTEAPMASFCFCIALMIEVFFVIQKSKIRILLLSLAIISTFSTSGSIILIFIIANQYLIKSKETSNSFFYFLRFPLVLLILIVGGYTIYFLVNQKMETGSGAARLDDYRVCFIAWIHHPVLGCGIGNGAYIQSFMSPRRYALNRGLSNSIGLVLAQGGIFLFALYVFSFSRAFIYTRNEHKNSLMFIFCMLVLFAITIIPYNYITLFIMLWFSFGFKRCDNSFLKLFHHSIFLNKKKINN